MAQVVELLKSLRMISKLVQFPGILSWKILVSTFAWAKTWVDSSRQSFCINISQSRDRFNKHKVQTKSQQTKMAQNVAVLYAEDHSTIKIGNISCISSGPHVRMQHLITEVSLKYCNFNRAIR